MEGKLITLPAALTAANSKDLLRECRRTLRNEPLCLDGSALQRMDYSADAFFALLADISETSGNKLTLLHFNDEVKINPYLKAAQNPAYSSGETE